MTRENRKPNWRLLTMIPVMHEMTLDMLKSARAQIANLRLVKSTPYLLDDKAISKTINTYRKKQQTIPRYLEHCKQWRKETLNRRQLTWVKEIEVFLALLDKTITELLTLAQEIESTTDKILQKDEAD